MSGRIDLLNTIHWIRKSWILFSTNWSFFFFGFFERTFSVITFSDSIFGQTRGYRIDTMSKEPIRLLEFQNRVFGIL